MTPISYTSVELGNAIRFRQGVWKKYIYEWMNAFLCLCNSKLDILSKEHIITCAISFLRILRKCIYIFLMIPKINSRMTSKITKLEDVFIIHNRRLDSCHSQPTRRWGVWNWWNTRCASNVCLQIAIIISDPHLFWDTASCCKSKCTMNGSMLNDCMCIICELVAEYT